MLKTDMDLYRELGSQKVDRLYYISCIQASDGTLDDDETMKLASVLSEMYIKDEVNRSISELSDLLVKVKDEIEDKTAREILILCDNYNFDDEEW